jgi:ribosome recycling factor
MKESELPGKCEGVIEHFKKEASKLRTGRVHAGVLDSINVEYYGSMVPLKQLAVINSPEPRQLTVQAYDSSAVVAIEKAIMSCEMGLNPSRDGNLLRVWIPPLTEERRKESVKSLHRLGEDTKVTIRGLRRDIIDSLKGMQKDKEISDDEFHRRQEKVQKTIDEFVKKIDVLIISKEKELMEV